MITPHPEDESRVDDHGAHSSFIEDYEECARALYAWARLHVKPALRRLLEPEDVLQEVCFRAYEGYADFDPSLGGFRPWVFGIANNVLRESLRRIGRNRETPVGPERWPSYASLPDDATSISKRVVRDESLRGFVDRLDRLSEEERRLLLYRGLEGLSHAETAVRLDLSQEATEKRWQRLLSKLREWGADLSEILAP